MPFTKINPIKQIANIDKAFLLFDNRFQRFLKLVIFEVKLFLTLWPQFGQKFPSSGILWPQFSQYIKLTPKW